MTPVPLFDYLAQYRALQAQIDAALRRVLESGQLILGPEVDRFEARFAQYLGAEAGAVGVASGTDALAIGLAAVGVGPGDEVITVANTAVATVAAIGTLQARAVFCDVRPDTALMDIEQVPHLSGPRTRAVVPVHLYGNVVDVDRLRALLAGAPIAVVEDCAQAHGARLRGRHVGTLGDVGAFSFYPTKNLGAYGDGGLCVARDPARVEQMRRLRMYGFQGTPIALREGRCSRLDELQAAVLNVKLDQLEGYVERRRALARRYEQRLGPGIGQIRKSDDATPAPHLQVVRVAARDQVRGRLQERGIGSGVHYPMAIHRMPAYEHLGYAPGSLPVTEMLCAEVLSLPLYPELDEHAVDRVCAALDEVARGPA